MSWINGATRNFSSSLTIRDDMLALIEILGEPQVRSFGTKKNRKNEEVPDERAFCSVMYMGGSARYKDGDNLLPAVEGDTYTLWLSSTLSGKILEGMEYKDGNPAPILEGTKWKVWRGAYGRGGQRVYEAERLSADLPVTPKASSLPPEVKPEIDEEAVMTALVKGIEMIGEIDHDTWNSLVQSKGIPVDGVDALTAKMVEKGLITKDATKISLSE